MLPDEWFHVGVLAIDLVSVLIVVGYVALAVWALVRRHSVDEARLIVAEGALLGLSFKVAAALLKTLELHTWEQLLLFAAIFTLRTVLKQVFTWEQNVIRRDGAAPGV